MYSIVQFTDDNGASVSVVNNRWLTPNRSAVFWPPVKGTKAFNRILADPNTPDEKWKLYGIQRFFYETDDIEIAKKKLKLVEDTSDIQTEEEDKGNNSKRKRKQRLFSSSDSEEDRDPHARPPPLKTKICTNNEDTRHPVSESPSTSEKTISLSNVGEDFEELPEFISHQTGDKEPVTPVKVLHRSHRFRLEQQPKPKSSVPVTAMLPHVQRSTAFEDKVVSLLCHIKKQNDDILRILNEKECTGALNDDYKFPLKSTDNLNQCELLLKDNEKRANLIEYLKRIGGRDVPFKVSRTLKFLITDGLAAEFNYYGKRTNKKPFSQLILCAAVIEAIKTSTPTTTEKDIEDCIKVWLKHAPEREKKRLSRPTSQCD